MSHKNIKSEKSTQYSAISCKTLHTLKGNDVLIKHALIRAFYSIYNGLWLTSINGT